MTNIDKHNKSCSFGNSAMYMQLSLWIVDSSGYLLPDWTYFIYSSPKIRIHCTHKIVAKLMSDPFFAPTDLIPKSFLKPCPHIFVAWGEGCHKGYSMVKSMLNMAGMEYIKLALGLKLAFFSWVLVSGDVSRIKLAGQWFSYSLGYLSVHFFAPVLKTAPPQREVTFFCLETIPGVMWLHPTSLHMKLYWRRMKKNPLLISWDSVMLPDIKHIFTFLFTFSGWSLLTFHQPDLCQ